MTDTPSNELTARVEALEEQVAAQGEWDRGLWLALLDIALALREREPALTEALVRKWSNLESEYGRSFAGGLTGHDITAGALEPRVTLARVLAQLPAAPGRSHSSASHTSPDLRQADGGSSPEPGAERLEP